MNLRRVPPMAALRAFVAVAQAKSFTAAAKDLHLTQAAVSYQIRQLETELGLKLFVRGRKGLQLTDAAQAYLPVVRAALLALADATASIKSSGRFGLLRVSTSQSLAPRWLVARIRRYKDRFPNQDIRIDATDTLVDFSIADVDLAVRYAQSVDPGLYSEILASDRVFPVCSPDFLQQQVPLSRADELLRHTLLHDQMSDVTWSDWFAAAGARGGEVSNAVYLSHSGLAVDAALAGQGVALGRTLLVADDLEAGRLICPYPFCVASNYAYFAVCPRTVEANEKVRAFRDWLLAEARAAQATVEQRSLPLLSQHL